MIILFHFIASYTRYLWRCYINRQVSRDLELLFETNCQTETFEKYENRRLNRQSFLNSKRLTECNPIDYNLKCKLSEDDGKFFKSSNFDLNFEPAYYYEGKIRFHPPVFQQRYLTVAHIISDEKWIGEIKKVVDFGCSEIQFFNYLKVIRGITEVCVVDIDENVLNENRHRIQPWFCESYNFHRTVPLTVKILQGSVSQPDQNLRGVDAVVAIELIEHMYPVELEQLPINIFGYIKPRLAIFTTPNSDFNVLFEDFSGFRHHDHKFEWSREQFETWAQNICSRFPEYEVKFLGIGPAPEGREDLGHCSQGAVFLRKQIPENELSCDELNVNAYKLIDSVEFPKFDEVSSDVSTLNDASVYFRTCARLGDFEKDYKTVIPLSSVLIRVYRTCKNTQDLRRILAEKYKIEVDSNGEEVVVYSGESDSDCDESDSGHFDCAVIEQNENTDVKESDSIKINNYEWEYGSGSSWDSVKEAISSANSDSDASCGNPEDLKQILINFPSIQPLHEPNYTHDLNQQSAEDIRKDRRCELETIVSVSDECQSSNVSSNSHIREHEHVMDSEKPNTYGSYRVSSKPNYSTSKKEHLYKFPSDDSLPKTKSSDSLDVEHCKKSDFNSLEDNIEPFKHEILPSVSSEDCSNDIIDEKSSEMCENFTYIDLKDPQFLVYGCDENDSVLSSKSICDTGSEISGNSIKLPTSVQSTPVLSSKPLSSMNSVEGSMASASGESTKENVSCKKRYFVSSNHPGSSDQVNRASSLDLDTGGNLANVEDFERSFSSDRLCALHCHKEQQSSKTTSDESSHKETHSYQSENPDAGTFCVDSNPSTEDSNSVMDYSNSSHSTASRYNPDVSRRFSSSSFIYKSQSQEKIKEVYSFRSIPSEKSESDVANCKDRNSFIVSTDVKDVESSLYKCHSTGKISHDFSAFFSNDGPISNSCVDKFPSASSTELDFSKKHCDLGRERRCMSVSCIGNINVDCSDDNSCCLDASTMEEREQQNSCSPDKFGPDSGYPNSSSGLDMEMDTPEQVKEIMTESESSFDDSPPESPVAEMAPVNHPPVIPVGENVENGDVANNNRDGEGNNMVGPAIVGDALEFHAIIEEREGNLPLMEAACNPAHVLDGDDKTSGTDEAKCVTEERTNLSYPVELDSKDKEVNITDSIDSVYPSSGVQDCPSSSSLRSNDVQTNQSYRLSEFDASPPRDDTSPTICLETNNNGSNVSEALNMENVDQLHYLVPLSLVELVLNSIIRQMAEEILSQLQPHPDQMLEIDVIGEQRELARIDHNERRSVHFVENVEILEEDEIVPTDIKGGGDSVTENI